MLGGGLEKGRVFLVEGQPGTGKTTIATQFLLAGAAAGERPGASLAGCVGPDTRRDAAVSTNWSRASLISVAH